MQKLTLNDETVLENSYVIEDEESRTLFLYTQNEYTLKDVFDNLYDQEKAKKIVMSNDDDVVHTFKGYKRLIAVRDEGRGMVTAVLKK